MKNKLLTTREVSQELGLSEKEIIHLAQANKIPHFRIGEEFFRFKKIDILRIKPKIRKKYSSEENRRFPAGRLREFIYFNDFYIAAFLAVVFLLWLIMKDFF